jgi:hypothetical protein
MLTYINSRLNQWAEWCRRREDGGLGFPRECSYARLQARSSSAGYIPIDDGEAWEIERAVQHLRLVFPQLHQVVTLFYRRTMTGEQMARECECCRDTLYHRLHMSHVEIMNWIHDECAREHDAKKIVDTAPTVAV